MPDAEVLRTPASANQGGDSDVPDQRGLRGRPVRPLTLSDDEWMSYLATIVGPCICFTIGDDCDEDGDPGCRYCQSLDPEWPCPGEDPAAYPEVVRG